MMAGRGFGNALFFFCNIKELLEFRVYTYKLSISLLREVLYPPSQHGYSCSCVEVFIYSALLKTGKYIIDCLFIDMQCRFFSLFSSREAIFLNISSFVILKDVGWNARHLLQVMFVIDVKYLVCWWLVRS
jgi:hypothetical protein